MAGDAVELLIRSHYKTRETMFDQSQMYVTKSEATRGKISLFRTVVWKET